MMSIYAQELLAKGRAEGEARGEARGKALGEAYGLQKGESGLLLRQIQRKFGPAPAWVTTRLENAVPGELALWSERILDVDSLEALFDESGSTNRSH
ncbi:MAG: hypothetical protein HQL56_15375 [Magnetococcales bacterium]|nr:hypothetical protein [Magnetococcales bacterium]